MLEDKGTSLRGVTLEAGFVMAEQPRATALERLGKIRSAAFDRVSLVRVMAIRTTHFPLEHGMVMRQFEFRAHFQMALETRGRGFPRVNNQAAFAATLDV